MDNRLWMYQDFPKRLHMIDYCNDVKGFINYTLSNLRKISGGDIRCSCKRYKNKKFIKPNVVIIHLLHKRFMKTIRILVCIRRTICPYETMIERMVVLTSSFSNVHGFVDDNGNPYKNMIIDAMRMNQGYADECLIIDE